MIEIENFEFKKKFGQNFIFDKNLLSSIVSDANISKESNILEIGAGAGTLTKKLAEKAKKVVAYEIDKTLTEHLDKLTQNFSNLKIRIKDVLKEPIEEIEKNFNGERYSIVANLPYYITSPLIFKFLEETSNVNSITVMVQKEVAERYTAIPNSKEYGIATVMINYYADIKYLRTINRRVFNPIPNVDSALIQIIPNSNKSKVKDRESLKKIVKAAFSMRRKTLINNLTKNYGANKESLILFLKKLNKSLTIRAEELSIEEFIYLADNLTNK